MSAAAPIQQVGAPVDQPTPLERDTHQPRFAFVDALRGIAALMVAGFHFYLSTHATWPIWPWITRPVGWVLARGDVGVNVFFVISGFVMAHSLRKAWITPKYFGNFVFRRSLRLDPPYWVTIALAYLAIALLPAAATGKIGGKAEGWRFLWPHFLYLQDILRTTRSHDHSVVGVFWTLCLEVQFYLTLIVTLWGSQYLVRALRRRWPNARHAQEWGQMAFFAPLLIFSMVCAWGFNRSMKLERSTWVNFQEGWFFRWWFMFFSGVLIHWTLQKRVRVGWLVGTWIGMAVLWGLAPMQMPAPPPPVRTGVVAEARPARAARGEAHWWTAGIKHAAPDHRVPRGEPASEERNVLQKGVEMTLIAGILVFAIGLLGRLETFCRHSVFQYFGRISYSLYMVHLVVGVPLVWALYRWLPARSGMGLVIFLVGMAASVLVADLMYRTVERNSTALSKRFKTE